MFGACGCVATHNTTAWQAWRNGRCLWAKQTKQKCGQVFGRGTSLSLSLSLSLLALFGILTFLNTLFLGFCALFVILSLLQKRRPNGLQGASRSKKSKEFKIRFVYGYFAIAQYDKFGLLSKNNGYFYSNFKAQIQIFHSKFKAFYKFKSFDKFKAFYKFNSFHNFISNFKPYTRLFHIFTPHFLYFHSNRFQNFEKFNTRSSL